MVDAAEVCQAECTDVFINRIIAGDNWQFCWWFSCLGRCPDDIRSFDIGVWQVEDTGNFFDIEDKAFISK